VSKAEEAAISTEVDDLDSQLAAAERAGDTEHQVTILRARAAVWDRYADVLRRDGRQWHDVVRAHAQRDLRAATELESALMRHDELTRLRAEHQQLRTALKEAKDALQAASCLPGIDDTVRRELRELADRASAVLESELETS
jgi:hypothetical protein